MVFISITNIMSYNLINLILTTNKLTRPNHVDWKRNLDIVLTPKEQKWITQELAHSTPNEHSTQEEKENNHNWQRADQKTKCTILRSLDIVLQHQHMSMPTTCNILISFHEMFSDKGRLARQDALWILRFQKELSLKVIWFIWSNSLMKWRFLKLKLMGKPRLTWF